MTATPASSHQCYCVGAGKFATARIGYGNEEGEEPQDEANARLIAAAPDLLEALKSAAESIEQLVKLDRIPANNKGLRDARAAIAKATEAA